MISSENNIKVKKSRKVLAIDDSPIDLTLLEVHLQKMGLIMLSTQDAGEGIEMVLSEQPDLILLDVLMPEIDGYEVCRRLKADMRTSSIPIVFISTNEQSNDKVAGLELGAIDYITKPFDPGELRARIGIILKMTELQEELLTLANIDELTGLANRRYLFDIIEREILQSRIKGNTLSLMILDIDHFKSVNDTYGHIEGDTVLHEMGKIIRENIYPLDIAARYGGEEFVVLMPETSHEKALKAAERLRKIIDSHCWSVSGEQISVTVSVGLVGTGPSNLLDSGDIVKKADTALYAAKRQGRNCVVSWDKVDPDEEVTMPENPEFHELQAKIALQSRQLQSHIMGTVSAFVETINVVVKDQHVIRHAENAQVYASAVAEEMGLSDELKERIDVAVLLHDLGKISIPAYILQKSTPLTKQDWQVIKQHPVVSTRILASIKNFDLELDIIRHHHERFDGSGYPDGLKRREIPIGSRILSIVDAFDAMTSDRPYRLALSCEAALKEIADCSGSQFDPDVVDAFYKAYEKYKEEWPLAAEECLVESA